MHGKHLVACVRSHHGISNKADAAEDKEKAKAEALFN
jgi:hypothetical protein